MKYKGLSSLPIEIKTLRKVSQEALNQSLEYVNKIYGKSDIIKPKDLEDAYLAISNEIAQPITETADYFKRNVNNVWIKGTVYSYKSEQQTLEEGGIVPYKVSYYQKICNEKLVNKLIHKKSKLVVSISTSGSRTRFEKVLTSIVEDALVSGLNVLIVIGVNETFDNTINSIIEFSKKTNIPIIINEIPPGFLDGYSVQNRTVSLNLNLYTIRKQLKIEDAYLAIIDDDILFPMDTKDNLKRLIEFLNTANLKVTSATTLPYPRSFFGNLKDKKLYYHPIFYEVLAQTYIIDLQDNIPPRPNVHGGCMLMKLCDHPLYTPPGETFQDLWLTEYFLTKNGGMEQSQTPRCKYVSIYHHEPTCLITWISKWSRILSMIQSYTQQHPGLDGEVNRLINLRFEEIIKNLGKDKKQLSRFLIYEFTKRNALKLLSGQ